MLNDRAFTSAALVMAAVNLPREGLLFRTLSSKLGAMELFSLDLNRTRSNFGKEGENVRLYTTTIMNPMTLPDSNAQASYNDG